MRSIHTFNHYHLGDQLVHLHFLRALAKQHPELFFTHTCDAKHLAQLHPVVADLPNLSLSSDWSALPPGALNAWRGDNNHWYQHPLRNDFAAYHLRWFEHLAQRLGGLRSPFAKPEDLLFDYPALEEKTPEDRQHFDYLIVNSPPKSGQWSGFDFRAFEELVDRLCVNPGISVITTHPIARTDVPCTQSHKQDVTSIGQISQVCRTIIGCVTGPMWPTLNIWNAARPLRIHLLDTERVEFCTNTVHANSLSLVPEILRARGLL